MTMQGKNKAEKIINPHERRPRALFRRCANRERLRQFLRR